MATYCGRFDDFAAHHTSSAITSLGQLNHALFAAALMGDDCLLINDGHLVLHPALRQAVTDPDSSPLRTLVERGYIRILTRNKNQLGALIPHMADTGIASAQKLLADPTYTGRYEPALSEWTGKLTGGGYPNSFQRWPRYDTTEIFGNVSDSAYDNAVERVQPTHKTQLEEFRARLDDTERRRTDWEGVAYAMLRDREIGEEVHGALMRMANEAYQYAWGCALRDSDERVQVDTEAPSYLNIDVTFAAPENRHRERISIYVPNTDFVAKKVGRQWPRLADVVTPGTEANEARQRFVRTLKRYYTSDDVEHRDMQAQARAYSRALREHFGNSKMTEVIFGGVVMNAVGTVAGTAAAGAAAGVAAGPAGALIGAGAGFAVGFVGTVASVYWGVPQSLFRLRARPGSGWIVPTDGHRGGGTSTFQIDPQMAERFLRNVSAFDPGA